LVGKTGKAMTVLRPSGKVIIDNEVYDAVSNQGFINSGTTVTVVKFENMQIYVEKCHCGLDPQSPDNFADPASSAG
jgi:membrane-bound serine protease (ClpP class)